MKQTGALARAGAWTATLVFGVAAFMALAGTLDSFREWKGPVVAVAAVGVAILAGYRLRGRRARIPSWRDPWDVVLLAAAVRMTWALLVPSRPVSDFATYLNLAQNLVERGIFGPDGRAFAFRPVGFPAVVAAVSRLGLGYREAAVAVNVAVSALTVLPVRAWTKLAFGERAARVASVVWAIFPGSVLFAGIAGTEPLFTFLFVSFGYGLALAAVRLGDARPVHLILVGAALGIATGLASYVRAHALLLPLFVAVPLALGRGFRIGRTLLLVGATTAVAVLVLLPWGFRNQREIGRFTLLTTNGGSTLWLANHPGATGTFTHPPLLPGETDVERSRAGYRMAFAWIRRNPGDFLALVPKKWFHLFKSETDTAAWATNRVGSAPFAMGVRAATQTTWVALVLLALAGALATRRRGGPATAVAAATLLYWLLLHAIFQGQPRFHYPLLPLFCMYAGAWLGGRSEPAYSR